MNSFKVTYFFIWAITSLIVFMDYINLYCKDELHDTVQITLHILKKQKWEQKLPTDTSLFQMQMKDGLPMNRSGIIQHELKAKMYYIHLYRP